MKRVILIGKAASGKDFARKYLQQAGFDFQVSYTTRPPRVGEIHGKDYFFLEQKEFERLSQEGAWHEIATFQGLHKEGFQVTWYYGTLKSQFEGKNRLFIMSPAGLKYLSPEERKESLVVYFNPKDTHVIKQRLVERGWTEEQIDVRQEADRLQFEGFHLDVLVPGIEVNDAFFDPAKLLREILDKFKL